jgi:hypothetical protein
MFIDSNPSLRSLMGLAALFVIGGPLEIWYNDNLESMEGAGNLNEIRGDLHIWHNEALRSLDGIVRLEELGGDLEITDNISLPTCEAEALRDRLISLGWTGEAEISGNDDSATCE